MMAGIGKNLGRLDRGRGADIETKPPVPLRMPQVLPILLLILPILLTMASCAPSGRAVGDTWRESDVPHQGKDTSSLIIALIGHPSSMDHPSRQNLDSRILSSLKGEGMAAYYWQASSVEDQQSGVNDAVNRGVSLILLDSPAPGDWQSCLGKARNAGIPVSIIQEEQAGWRRGLDSTYYAAILSLTEKEQGVAGSSLGDALKNIIDDGPHDRTIRVILDDQGGE